MEQSDTGAVWDADWQAARAMLSTLSEPMAKAALAAGIPRVINASLLESLLEVAAPQGSNLLRRLQYLEFLEPREGGKYRVSEASRRGLWTVLRAGSPGLFSTYHVTAHAYFVQINTAESRIEALYHQIAGGLGFAAKAVVRASFDTSKALKIFYACWHSLKSSQNFTHLTCWSLPSFMNYGEYAPRR